MKQQIIDSIMENKIIVVMRGFNHEETLKTAQALYDGGIRLVEVAFDQNSDSNAETGATIKALNDNFGDKMQIGAGTVLTEEQLMTAYKAGAKYIISPVTDGEIIRKTNELGLVSIPGALTPSEIVTAHKLGADFVKVFPAGTMGAKYFKDVTTPLSHIKLLAVAGVTTENLQEFVSAGAVGFGISSGIVSKSDVKSGDFEAVTRKAKAFTSLLK